MGINQKINKAIFDRMRFGTREQRMYIGEQLPLYYAAYYFPEIFKYQIAPFHVEFSEDFISLTNGDCDEDVWIAHRESAKTTWAKIFVTWCISYQKKRFVNVDSEDLANSEGFLYDIITWLQTNRRLIADFGFLYKNPIQRKKEIFESDKDMKRASVFTTTHKQKIMVRAYSTQQTTRGRVFGREQIRPDLYIFDDVENSKTIRSRVTMDKIIEHMIEAYGGLAPNASTLFLGNYLTEEGVVQWAIDHVKNNPKGIFRNVSVKDENGDIIWKDKYVETDREAEIINRKIKGKNLKVSLESVERRLGTRAFQTDMLNNPVKAGDYYFDREKVDQAIKNARAEKKRNGNLKLWEDFNPRHRYGLGADTAEGISLDSSTIGIIDFSMYPNKVVATSKDNTISPTDFAYDIARAGRIFGECFVVPEINNTGYGTVGALVSPNECEYYNTYKRKIKNKKTKKITSSFGFKTDKATKPDILSKFRSAFEDGELEILDVELLEEMRRYRIQDSRVIEKVDNGVNITRHFDLIMAVALAYEAKEHATLSKNDKKNMYKAPKREPYRT